MLSIFRQQLDRGQSLLRLSDHGTIDQVGNAGMPRALIKVIESSGYHLASAGNSPCLGRMTPRT
jgi:hypothetical protein